MLERHWPLYGGIMVRDVDWPMIAVAGEMGLGSSRTLINQLLGDVSLQDLIDTIPRSAGRGMRLTLSGCPEVSLPSDEEGD